MLSRRKFSRRKTLSPFGEKQSPSRFGKVEAASCRLSSGLSGGDAASNFCVLPHPSRLMPTSVCFSTMDRVVGLGLCLPTNSKGYPTAFQGRAGPPDPPRNRTGAPGIRTRRTGCRALPCRRFPSASYFPANTHQRAGSGTSGHFHCVPVGPAVSNPKEGSRSARRSDPTPGPRDKVQRRWALGIRDWRR